MAENLEDINVDDQGGKWDKYLVKDNNTQELPSNKWDKYLVQDSDVKKKPGYQGGATSFPITSVWPLQKGSNEALTEGAGIANNSFLKQINSQTPLRGLASSDEGVSLPDYKGLPVDKQGKGIVTLTPKKVEKQYYNEKLEKPDQVVAPSDLVSYNPITVDKEGKSKLSLKGQDEDYIEKIRKEPYEPFKEGSYLDLSAEAQPLIPGGLLVHATLAQNFIDKVLGNAAQAGAGLVGMYRDLTDEFGTKHSLYDKEGKPTKYADSMTWLSDPSGKIIQGLTSASHDFKNDVQSGGGKLPVTKAGGFINDLTDIGADIATSAALPEAKFLEGTSTLAKVGNALGGKFTGYLGAKGALNAYQSAIEHGESGLEATGESLKGTAKGLGSGAVLGLAGTGSDFLTKSAMKPLEKMGIVGLKGMLTKEGINTITDGITYGAITPSAEAFAHGRTPTADEMKNGFATSLAFSAKRLLGNATNTYKLNKAISQIQDIKQGINLSNFMDADPETIINVYNGKKTAQELNLEALEAAANARKTTDLQKKQEYISQAVVLSKAAGVKQMTNILINNKGALDNLLQDQSISDNVKQTLAAKAELITKQLDPIEQQKNELGGRISQAQTFIEDINKQIQSENNPVTKAELEVKLEGAQKILEDNTSKLKDLIKSQQKPDETEDLTTKEGIIKSKDKFNKDIDNQINELDKNSDNYQNDLDALNKKRDESNQHYDELLNPSPIVINQEEKGEVKLTGDTEKQKALEDKLEELKRQRDALRSEDGSVPTEKIEEFSRLNKEIYEAENATKRGNSGTSTSIKKYQEGANPETSNAEYLSGKDKEEAANVIENIIKNSKSAEEVIVKIRKLGYEFDMDGYKKLNKYLEDRYNPDAPKIGNNKDSFQSWIEGKSDSENKEVTPTTEEVITPTVEKEEPTITIQKEEPKKEQLEKEEPEKEEPEKEEPVEKEKTGKISKEGLKEDYNFTKEFETRTAKDVVNDTMERLENSAAKNKQSIEEQAADEVKMIKTKKSGDSSEHDIITTAFHLRNLDAKIERANENGEDTSALLNERDEALQVLRKLGNNAGRNLGLFNNAYKVAENGKLEVMKADIKQSLGLDKLPSTIEELNKSNLTPKEKKLAEPYVKELENVKKQLEEINKNAKTNLKQANKKAIDKYIEEESKKTTSEEKATLNKAEAKKAANKLRDIADNIESFMKSKGAEGAQKAGISIDIQKKIADAIRYVADKIENGNIPDLIVRAINKFAGEGLSEKELNGHINDALLNAGIDKSLIDDKTSKDKAIDKIIDIAKDENATRITKSMAYSGLINDVVNHYIHLDTPYDKVIEEATNELKQHLPNVKQEDVENAILNKGEFKKPTKEELKTEIQQKTEDVKRLARTSLKVRALQVGAEIEEIKNNPNLTAEEKKAKIEARKSEYEKSLNKILDDHKQAIKDQIEKDKKSKAEYRALETERNRQLKIVSDLKNKLNKLSQGIRETKEKVEPKKDTPEIEALKDKVKEADKKLREIESAQRKEARNAKNIKDKIESIENEIDHVGNEKKVFEKTIKSKADINKELSATKIKLAEEYRKAGIRIESGDKTQIQIAKDAENEIEQVKNNKELSEDVKKEHISAIEKQRDEALKNTRQGVLVNLKSSIDNHVNELDTRIDDLNKQLADAQKTGNIDKLNELKQDITNINEVKIDLANLSKMLKPNSENLQDQIDKADQDLNAIIKSNKGNEFEDNLKDIQKQYHDNWQKTSDELQTQDLLNKAIKSRQEAERRLAAGQYTSIPTTPLDVTTNKILTEQQAETEKAWSKLNSMAFQARQQQQQKGLTAKILEARKQIMVASFSAIEKVAGSGLTKPIIDPIIKQSFGRLSSLITGIRPTEVRNIGKTFAQLKNDAAASDFMAKANKNYLKAIEDYGKAKGTPNEEKALLKMKEAEIDHNAAFAYLFINANSAVDIAQIMMKGATDFDAKAGKYKQSFPEQRSKLQEIAFWLEAVNRTHAAIKSVSQRQALMDDYIQNLQHFQDKDGNITQESRQQAWDAAVLSSEAGRFGENTILSDLISKGRNAKTSWLRNLTNFTFPVAKIGINITKQGVDMAFPGLEAGAKLYNAAGQGMKMNEAQGKEFSNAVSRFKEGIKTGYNELPLEQKKYINTLLYRGLFGVAQYALVGYLLSNGTIKYGGAYDESDPYRKKAPRGSDNLPLKAGEWEINGHRMPKIVNMVINHSPYSLPASVAASAYNQMHSHKESQRHIYLAYGKVLNEVYERLPIASSIDMIKALTGSDEYKFNRMVANEVPNMKNVAEYFDVDENGNPIQRKAKTKGEMMQANYPWTRRNLQRKY